MNIFVGNLSFDATGADIKKLFEGFGTVASAVIVMRKEKKTPKSRGFGFVEMPDPQQALAAIAGLHGTEFMGRALDINPTRAKKSPWTAPAFNKPGTYGGGRRTRSYVKQHGPASVQKKPRPQARYQDNPMRWRKKKDQPGLKKRASKR